MFVASRLCIDTHSTQATEYLRLCILLDYSRYFRILPQWTDLYSRFSRFTAVAMYDNPAHCRILALIRHCDPRISISIPIWPFRQHGPAICKVHFSSFWHWFFQCTLIPSIFISPTILMIYPSVAMQKTLMMSFASRRIIGSDHRMAPSRGIFFGWGSIFFNPKETDLYWPLVLYFLSSMHV